MHHLVAFAFAAHLTDRRRLDSSKWVFCRFLKPTSRSERPRPGQCVEIGGVAFIYEGPPLIATSIKTMTYVFTPCRHGHCLPVLDGGEQAPTLLPKDNQKFPDMKAAFRQQNYKFFLTHLNGDPLT